MVPEMEPVECTQDEVPLEQLKVPEIFVPDWEKVRAMFINPPEISLVAVPAHVPEIACCEAEPPESFPPQPKKKRK